MVDSVYSVGRESVEGAKRRGRVRRSVKKRVIVNEVQGVWRQT